MIRGSLQKQLLQLVLVTMIPVFVVHETIEIRGEIGHAREHTTADARNLAATTVPLLKSALIVGDIATAQETLDNIARPSQFRGLRLLDPSRAQALAEGRAGTTNAETRVPDWFVDILDYRFASQEFAVEAGGTTYGILVVEPSSRFLVAAIWERIWMAILTWTVSLVIFAALLKVTLWRGMKPLDDLVDAAHRFGNGDLSCRAPVGDVPELARTAQAFNRMADHLAETHDQLEERVRLATRELENLVTRIPAGVYKLRISPDDSMRFDYVSPRWCELIELDAETVARDPWAPLSQLHPDETDGFIRRFDAAKAGMALFQWEGRLRDGLRVRWLRIEAMPTALDNGDVLWEGIQYDVTVRRQAGNLLQSIIDVVDEGLLLIDATGRVAHANRRFQQLWAIPDELLAEGEDERLLSHVSSQLSDPDGFLAEVQRLYPTDEVAWALIEFKDGRIFERYTCPVLNDTGRARLWSFRDITERRRIERDLRRLNEAVAHASESFIICDADLRLQYVNPAFESLFDYRLAEIEGKSISLLLPDDEALASANPIVKGEFSGEKLRRAKDGRLVPVLLKVAPINCDDGTVAGYVATMTDLTTIKAAEAHLDNERRHLRTVLNAIPDLVWLKDTAGVYLDCNPEFERFFGTREADIVGKTDFDFVDAELAEHFRRKDRDAVAVGGPSTNEEWVTYVSDGRRVLLETVKTPMFDATGQIVGVLGIARDITERRGMEEKLQREHIFRQRIMDATPGVFYLIDANRRFRLWNHNLETVSGRTAAEVGAIHPLDLFDETEKPLVERAIQQVFAEGESSVEASIVARDGARTPYYFNGYLVDIDSQPALLGIGLDISARKQAENALRDSEEKLRGLYELSPLGIALTDMDGHYIEFNEAFRAICGYPADELRQLDYWTLTPRKYAADEQRQLAALEQTGRYGPYEKEYQRKDGSLVPLSLNGMRVKDRDGKPCIWSIVEDITRQKVYENVLQQTIRELDNLIARIPVGVYKLRMLADDGMRFDYVSPRWCELLEIGADEVYRDPQAPFANIHPDDVDVFIRLNEEARATSTPFEWEGRLRDGMRVRWLHMESTPTEQENGDILWEGIQYDITATKEHEAELDRIAHYDALTGIPNRVLLADRMQQAIAHAQRTGTALAVCYLDLDGFKPVNDALGHQAGDALLVEIAHRLHAIVRGGDTVARIGGDEFVLLLVGMERMDEYEATLNRILEVVGDPILIDQRSVSVSASIGISLYPQDEADPDLLLRHADQAMYQAKQAGRNMYHFFDPNLEQAARKHHDLLLHIEHGMHGNEFELHYQPKVNMRRGTVVGFEALVRWRHPERGLLLPGEFLPLIEDHELIVALGDWVIDRALTQLGTWHRQGMDISVSVNIAPRHLQRSDFVERLRQSLAIHADAPAGKLEIEIVETAALSDTAHVAKLIDQCRQLGVSFALDDFGTGYSSLTYLKNLPAQTLKIDQSFVRDMLVDSNDLAIVEGVIGLTEVFRRQVIAEGVETIEHGTLLLNLGCELAQGFGIARPMPADQVGDWVRTWKPDPAWNATDGFRWPRDDLPLIVAESNHRAWIENVAAYVDASTTEPPELDTDHCRFGQWYAGGGRRRYGKFPEFAAIAEVHANIHELGRMLIELTDQGEQAAAKARLPELFALRDKLLNLLHRLMTIAVTTL